MFNAFACGAASFKHHQEDDHWNLSRLMRSKSKKNPYSSRGVDKFLGLLAELEERKEKIYAEMGSPKESLVRFGYSSTNEWIPIVVRVKDQPEAIKAKVCEEKEDKSAAKIHDSEVLIKSPKGKIHNSEVLIKSPRGVQVEVKEEEEKKNLWRYQPQLCLVMVIVLILLCLVVSGKSLAVLCACIGWYLLPSMKEDKMNLKNCKKKKDYGRWLSEKRMNSEAPVVAKSLRRGQSNKNW